MPREFVKKKRRRSALVRVNGHEDVLPGNGRNLDNSTSPMTKTRRVESIPPDPTVSPVHTDQRNGAGCVQGTGETESTTSSSLYITTNDGDDNQASFVIPPRMNFMAGLRDSQRVFQLETGQCILADCDISTGHLKNSYVILDKKTFNCMTEQKEMHVYLCRCPVGSAQRERLLPMCDSLSSEFYNFYYQETDDQCFHAEAACSILGDTIAPFSGGPAPVGDEQVFPRVQQLSEEPFLVAVETETGLDLLQRNRAKNLCCSCAHGKYQCKHKVIYSEWVMEQTIVGGTGEEDTARVQSIFTCISKQRIQVPLSLEQQELYRNYESGQQSFPVDLVPRILPDQSTCTHGFQWNAADPVVEGWVAKKATIYKEGCSITHLQNNGIVQPITVYYRPSTGDCGCKLEYDGNQDLLLNLNNTGMVYYGVLFSYLHHMLEGRNPLAACHRAYSHSHTFLSGTKCIPLHKLRLAWNSFARLLDIDWAASCECPKCGIEPSIIVCDGTMLGCRKDLLHRLHNDTVTLDNAPITGSLHKKRVFIPDKKIRKLLLQYATQSTPLTSDEFRQLVDGLQLLGRISLMDLIIQLSTQTGYTAPTSTAPFIRDLTRNGPACSLVQGATPEMIEDLKDILARDIPIFQSEWSDSLQTIQSRFPVIYKLLARTHMNGHIPSTINKLITDVLDASAKSFEVDSSSSNAYSPPDSEPEMFQSTGFFPSLPKNHRKARYVIDKTGQDLTCRTQTECRKYARGHPTLSPGIFTIFCPHGVCYGFQVMTRYESPEVPFDIFKSRFSVAPKVVIYDNACRLHAYCLNREPEFFRNTIIVVDRMHWHNHKSCSSGYSVNSYGDFLDLNKINTQVNEQANAGLGRIKSQLAYMLPDNFVFHAALYLSLKNDKKRAGLR